MQPNLTQNASEFLRFFIKFVNDIYIVKNWLGNTKLRADFPWLSHLFDIGIIKENPLRGFGVVGEGTVMFAGVTDHANQQQLALLRALIRDAVKQLQKHTNNQTITQSMQYFLGNWCTALSYNE